MRLRLSMSFYPTTGHGSVLAELWTLVQMQSKMKRQSSLLSHFVQKNTTDKEELSDKKSKTETEVIEIRSELKWETIEQNNLHVSYSEIFTKSVCRKIFSNLEREVEYFTGELSQVKVFGKVYPIPRKQSAYGDEGAELQRRFFGRAS